MTFLINLYLWLLSEIPECLGETRPSRLIRCDMWIVERMRYRPTNQPTNRPTDTASYRGALSHLITSVNAFKNAKDKLKETHLKKQGQIHGNPVEGGWALGRSCNAKTARNSKRLRTEGRTNTARCRVACPRLKTICWYEGLCSGKCDERKQGLIFKLRAGGQGQW